MVRATRTTCPYCGVGCGIVVNEGDDKTIQISGDEHHPANFGRLCSKGSALGETLSLDDRLLHPMMHGEQVSWNTALDEVAKRFMGVIDQYGPDAVAFYGSGQLLTEDYYVANKLMKGFIGSANMDTNSRLCMSSAVAAHKRAFGSDTVPGCYEDLEFADLIVIWGANMAWCHPVLYQRIEAAKSKRPEMKIVLIDPRRTATASICDMHLAVKPGMDTVLLNGLLHHLDRNGVCDTHFIGMHTEGVSDVLEAAGSMTICEVAAACDLAETDVARLYKWFGETEKTVSVYSQGLTMNSSGTDKVNALLNCHLFTGRIGKPGMGPFSLTGQPNAMGGREVGGLANQLAAHMDLANPTHRDLVRTFWRSPSAPGKPGRLAVDMFEAIHSGEIKALWVMATNPADSLPQADRVREAMEICPFVVVSDVTSDTDTAVHADVLLPAAGWGEKDGTVTNSERRISRQRAFLPLPGEAKPDWWIICEVAKRMGFAEAFQYGGPNEIFDEHAKLSAHANDGTRDFNISALVDLAPASYQSMRPVQWPVHQVIDRSASKRFFADGQFYHPDGRARFVPTPVRGPTHELTPEYPFRLNTGRVRDQWHTMTRTAKTSRLVDHIAEPYVEINPSDAATFEISDASVARVVSPHGSILVRARITDTQKSGSLFVPFHWSEQYASRARVDALVSPNVDPISGQPESKHDAARIEPFKAAHYGFAISRIQPALSSDLYWARARAGTGWRTEFAGETTLDDPAAFLRTAFSTGEGRDPIALIDTRAGRGSLAMFDEDGLVAALYYDTRPVGVARAWAAEQLVNPFADPKERLRLLAGRPGGDEPDKGAIVCSCFSVGSHEISAAITSGSTTVETIGDVTCAGTNCGSCRSEIQKLLKTHRVVEAAE